MKDQVRIQNLKWIRTANLFYLFAVVILGVYFGYERALLLDGAYRIKTIAEYHQFPIWNSRFTSGLNFILPIAASLLDVSLKFIVNALVLNYILIPLAVFAFLRFRQTSIKYELAFLTGLTLFNFNSFFFASYEWWVGSFVFFALYRVLDEKELISNYPIRLIIGIALMVLVLFSHLNAVFCVPLLMLLLYKTGKIDLKTTAVFIILTIAYLAAKLTFLASPYEQEFVAGSSVGLSILSGILTSESLSAFMRSLYTTNLNMSIITVLIIYACVTRRSYFILILTAAGLIGSVLLVGYYFPDYGYNVYTEGWFKMVNLLIPVVIVELYFSNNKGNRAGLPLISLNYIFSIAILLIASKTFTQRYDLIARTCEEHNGPVIVNTEADLCPTSFMTMPLESSIINQLENGTKDYFTLNIRNHEATLIILRGLQNEKPGRFLDFTAPAKEISDEELGYDITGLAYDKYTTYRCVEFVRVLLKE